MSSIISDILHKSGMTPMGPEGLVLTPRVGPTVQVYRTIARWFDHGNERGGRQFDCRQALGIDLARLEAELNLEQQHVPRVKDLNSLGNRLGNHRRVAARA